MRTWVFVLALVPAAANAAEGLSKEQHVVFAGEADLFEGVDRRYDFDIIDSTRLAVTFSVQADTAAQIVLDMDALSQLQWPEPITQRWDGTGNPGSVGIQTQTDLLIEVTGSAFGIPLGYELWSERVAWNGHVDLANVLLRGGGQFTADLGIDGDVIYELDQPYDVGDLRITFGARLFPRLSGSLTGVQVATRRNDDAEAAITGFERLSDEGILDFGTRNPGYLELVSWWEGEADAQLSLVVQPWISFKYGSLTVGPFEYDYEIALFDDVATVLSDPYVYQHPLPALAVRPTVDFGSVKVGDAGDLVLDLSNLGDVPLTGLASVQGDGFFVLDDVVDLDGLADGSLRLQFVPTQVGLQTGTLHFETNDPIVPVVEVALGGTGLATDADPDDPHGEGQVVHLARCGCSASPALAAGWLPLLALLVVRRRRS